MPNPIEFETERLFMRQWRPSDRAPFAELNADPRVMEYFPAPLERDESNALADRCQALIEQRGWGFWAVELKASAEFIGFLGLHVPIAELPFSPCVEIGWRLAFQHWHKGLATEAARGHATNRHARGEPLRASEHTHRSSTSRTLPVPSFAGGLSGAADCR